MRQIFLDTETTGKEVSNGHRIIEIGAIEYVDKVETQKNYHVYLNPERKIDEEAIGVHGITDEQVAKEKKFRDVADDFIDFITGADEILIHNAEFDIGFLNAELKKAGKKPIWDYCPKISCTLKAARSINPGKRNNLDALCDRYAIDNTHRTLHGALLDAELLADVYYKMTDGIELLVDDEERANKPRKEIVYLTSKPQLKVKTATPEQQSVERTFLESMAKETGKEPIALGASTLRKPGI